MTVSKEGKDFISRMLARNPEDRLGFKNDVEEILSHPWFKDLSVEKMLKKEVRIRLFQLPTPFKPEVEGDDYINGFDREFTQEKPIYEIDKEMNVKEVNKFARVFDDF